MTTFWLLAAALGVAALAILLPAILRAQPSARVTVDARSANLSVLRAQLVQIDADHDTGGLDFEQHRRARSEVSRRVLEEEVELPAEALAGSARRTAIGLGVLVPALAIALYAVLGNPAALSPQATVIAAGADGEITAEKIAQMAELLTKRTLEKPDDVEAWTLLGHALRELQRFPDAATAYTRASQLMPTDAALLADLAYVLAMQTGTAAGEPTRLLTEALRLAPENLKVLSLAGSAAFERKDFAQAIGYWSRARGFAPPGSAFIGDIDQSLAQAREAAGLPQENAAAAPQAGLPVAPGQADAAPTPNRAGDANANKSASTAPVAGTTVSGRVRLSPALAAQARPTDTVFVFARASNGPRMPLAILKKQVSDLPLGFVLDDSSAMSSATSLSQFKMVVVGARISRSGQANPTAGDLVGQSAPLAVGSSDVELVIDSVQP